MRVVSNICPSCGALNSITFPPKYCATCGMPMNPATAAMRRLARFLGHVIIFGVFAFAVFVSGSALSVSIARLSGFSHPTFYFFATFVPALGFGIYAVLRRMRRQSSRALWIALILYAGVSIG